MGMMAPPKNADAGEGGCFMAIPVRGQEAENRRVWPRARGGGSRVGVTDLRISDAPTIGPGRARRGGEKRCPASVVRGATWVHLALPPLTQRSRRAPGGGR